MISPRRVSFFTDRSGMTVMELVAGITITGLALAAGYSAFTSVVDHRQRAEQATVAVARDAAIRHSLISWLAGARLPAEESGPAFTGFDGMHGTMADAELGFLTTAATPLGSGHTIVRLYIDRDEDTPERGLVAELTEWRGAASQRIEIEPRVAGLEIRYLSSQEARQWLPSWISSSVLPAGVELSLHAGEFDTLPPLLRLPILVSYGSSR